MEQLIKSAAAYKIFQSDIKAGRLSHAYMLYYADAVYLRAALKIFAGAFFGGGERAKRLIESEGLADCKIYPKADKKLNVEAAREILADGALRPVEGAKKLFVISAFEGASPIFQNKLLKILEEPPQGVHFLLGASSLSPVLPTVKSRVKLLEMPPFGESEIFAALLRKGENPLNKQAAHDCGGVLSVAENMLGERFNAAVKAAAEEICGASTVEKAVAAALKYGDFKEKEALLAQMQRLYFSEVAKYAKNPVYTGVLTVGAAIYAVECVNNAFTDLKFNANFPSLLYDLTLKIAQFNAGGAGYRE